MRFLDYLLLERNIINLDTVEDAIHDILIDLNAAGRVDKSVEDKVRKILDKQSVFDLAEFYHDYYSPRR